MLEVIGLGAEPETVYEVLLDRGPAAVGDLATVAGLTQQRARAVLHILETRGLVRRTSDRPARYAAADPGIALDVLLLSHEEQIKRARIHAQRLSERFHEAASRRDPAQLVEVVTGRDAVQRRVADALRSARREVRGFDKPPYAAQPDPAGRNDALVDLLRRDGTVRTIYERASVEVAGRVAGDITVGIARGEQDRVLPDLPMKLILVDDRLAIIPLQEAPTAIESAVVVHRSALLGAISALFETLWRVALPLELAAADPEPVDRLTQEERIILALLTTGLPDDGIARQLGISDRTLQRRMRELMERLGARTRFQLALQAARRGWLGDDLIDATAREPYLRSEVNRQT